MSLSSAHAAIAAHRFGLGERDLATLGSDPGAWLRQQIGPADAQPGESLPSSADGVRIYARFLRAQRQASSGTPMSDSGAQTNDQMFVEQFRELTRQDQRAHLAAAVQTTRPFAERLALFWANHFTVSMTKASVRGLVGAFEREAIRPHIAGPFERLLKAAVTHAAMLRYLDNDRSAGPRSRSAVRRSARLQGSDELRDRPTGLNENLAREVLELHTLGAASKAYTQSDVTAFAAVLTGWRLPIRQEEALELPSATQVAGFDPAWHEPGPKTVLGQRIPEGPGGLDAVLRLLTRHPATAQFVALKLARHFVADDPPSALVEALAARFMATEGDLAAVTTALLESPQAWQPTPSKLKTPEEFVVSAYRILNLGTGPLQRAPDAGLATLGQRLLTAPSPAGWPDRQEEWLGPDAVWKRVEWATRVADRVGRQTDARQLARQSLGPWLSPATAQQIERAADGPQALALLLLAPELQRR